MNNQSWKSKKEKIIEYVYRDPFLKIEDLADKAGTTPRYVRTILSEANISLMKMRKDYARQIEKKGKKNGEEYLFYYLLKGPFVNKNQIKPLNDLIINNPRDVSILKGDLTQDYIFKSYCHRQEKIPWCISGLILSENIKFQDSLQGYLNKPEDLVKLIKKMGSNYNSTNINLEIEKATPPLAELLNISVFTHVLKVKQCLKQNDENKILMYAYFHPERINISFSDKRGLVINRKIV